MNDPNFFNFLMLKFYKGLYRLRNNEKFVDEI